MDEKRNQLLEQTVAVFKRYGIRSVTMDDLARELKVSKKTIYKYVKDKTELVAAAVIRETEAQKELMEATCDKAHNAIEEQLLMAREASNKLREIHPSLFFDMEKYYPEAWRAFSEYKRGFISACMQDNIERGIKEGLYREELKPDIIARFYVRMIDMQFDPECFPLGEYPFLTIHDQMLSYHLHGIVTEKGKTYLEKFNSNTND